MTLFNRDGGVWRITWTQREGGVYRAWVISHPRVAVETTDPRQLSEAMHSAIDEELQAGEWTADWWPPDPAVRGTHATMSSEYVELCGDGRFVYLCDPDSLFDGGVCRSCGSPRGARTATELQAHVEIHAGLLSCCAGGPFGGALLVSAAAQKALGPSRIAGAVSRPVKLIKSGWMSAYSELAPTRALRPVVRRDMDIFGARCGGCDTAHFSERFGQCDYRSLFRRSEVPSGVEGFWLAGDAGFDASLCVRADWWAEARLHKALRGVIGRPLWLINDEDMADARSIEVRSNPTDQYQRLVAKQNYYRDSLGLPRLPST